MPGFPINALAPLSMRACTQDWAARVEACLDGKALGLQQLTANARCALLHSLHFDLGARLSDSCLHQLMQPLVQPALASSCRCV